MSSLKVKDLCHLLILFTTDHLLIEFNTDPELPGVTVAKPAPELPHWKYLLLSVAIQISAHVHQP